MVRPLRFGFPNSGHFLRGAKLVPVVTAPALRGDAAVPPEERTALRTARWAIIARARESPRSWPLCHWSLPWASYSTAPVRAARQSQVGTRIGSAPTRPEVRRHSWGSLRRAALASSTSCVVPKAWPLMQRQPGGIVSPSGRRKVPQNGHPFDVSGGLGLWGSRWRTSRSMARSDVRRVAQIHVRYPPS